MRAFLLFLALVAACDVQPQLRGSSIECSARLAVPWWHRLDVLMVVDDTARMAGRRDQVLARLARFRQFLSRWTTLCDGGWFHIGVIDADGDGSLRPACHGQRFLDLDSYRSRDNLDWDESLSDALDCAVDVGASGTRAQLLASAVNARGAVENATFWRDDAYRVVIFLAGGDDESPGDLPDLGSAFPGDPHDTFFAAFVDGAAPRLEAALATRPEAALAPFSGSDDAPLGQAFQCAISSYSGGCFEWSLSPTDPDCVVEQRQYLRDGTTQSVLLPRCDLARGSLPCWRVAENPRCPAGATTTFEIDRGLEEPPPSSEIRVFCECGGDNAVSTP